MYQRQTGNTTPIDDYNSDNLFTPTRPATGPTPMFTIGIAGGSGSGKTTLVERLQQLDVGGALTVLPHDAYYLNRDDMPAEVRETNNWDHPDAIDTTLFLQHIDHLKAGLTVDCPTYDFTIHRRTAAVRVLQPNPVLIVEGILVLALPDVRRHLDLKVFVDTPADLRLLRRMVRDVLPEEQGGRGRNVADVGHQYLTTVRLMHAQYVEPSRQYADLVVPWEWHNDAAVGALADVIRERG
jgi:uridine kinase